MKGNIEQLFRERFQGHEAPVDPGMWQAIQQQLGATAPAPADGVDELFRERFAEHEVQMDASVWEGISKELGHAAPAAPGQGMWGWAAATAGVLVVAAGLWYVGSKDRIPEAAPALVVTVEQPRTTASEQTKAEPASELEEARTVAPTSPTPSDPGQATATTAHTPTSAVSPGDVPPTDLTDDASPVVPVPATVEPNVPSVPTTIQTEPALVETIIQQITERTVNEVRANPEVKPTLEPAAETMAAATPSTPDQEVVTEIFMPNTFTPNGDQINDTYEVSRDGFEQLQMRVMSMKNDRLVFSTNTGEPWTGEGCEDGMYVVVVEAITTNGKAVSKAKVVWLNRERMN